MPCRPSSDTDPVRPRDRDTSLPSRSRVRVYVDFSGFTADERVSPTASNRLTTVVQISANGCSALEGGSPSVHLRALLYPAMALGRRLLEAYEASKGMLCLVAR